MKRSPRLQNRYRKAGCGMKRWVKNTTFQILLIVLFTGFVGILGIFILTGNLESFRYDYQKRISVDYEHRRYMDELSKLLYKHQAITARHINTSKQEEKDELETEANLLGDELKEKVIAFGDTIHGEKKEKIYHDLYSNTLNYIKSANVVLTLSQRGDEKTASYYLTGEMSPFLKTIDENTQLMQKITDREFAVSSKRMERNITIARTCSMVCLFAIILAVVVCALRCLYITRRVDKYRKELEDEIEAKSAEVLKHNRTIMDIQNNTLIGMATLIESRDGETGGHIKRTSGYVELLAGLAKEAGYHREILTDDYIELLVKAAPMHDIGKIVVPDQILKKPGKLTTEEYEIMKEHAARGGEIVKEVLVGVEEQVYIDIAADVAAHHHEKWNGTGYPDGLSGEDIPLSARIMAVADVFDALVSERCYKKPMPFDQAFSIIEKDAGSHFDPMLAKLFLKHRPEVEAIAKKS